MSTAFDRVHDLLRSTDEVKVVLEAIFIPGSAASQVPDARQDAQNKRILAYLKRNVFASQSDFELLAAIFVLLWPFCVVFPVAELAFRLLHCRASTRHTS